MKRVPLLLIGLLWSIHLSATPIDIFTAYDVAGNFMRQYVHEFDELDYVSYDNHLQSDLLYVFNLRGTDGFVIITGDDACEPILAYSTESDFDPENVPIQFAKMLFASGKEVASIRTQKLEATPEIRDRWKSYTNPSPVAYRTDGTEATEGVGPLIDTKWDQGTYYNDECPYDYVERQRTATGCVATAMAQLMKYHQYPQKGKSIKSYSHNRYGILGANFGKTTYNWSNMPNNVTRTNDDVATLMYHCGVSVDMDYGVKASSAYTDDTADALVRYFGYSENTQLVYRNDYRDSWTQLLVDELDAGRPMYYGGDGGGGGHAFICDGYDNNFYFHFNWGWGGLADSYYNINALNPRSLGLGGGLGRYNENHEVIIGIEPPSTSNIPITTTDLQLNQDIVVTPNPIEFGESLTVEFNLANRGSTTFRGDYAVVLLDSEREFVSYLGTKTEASGLESGFTYRNAFSVSLDYAFFAAGTYYVAAYFRERGDTWQLMQQRDYQNPVEVEVSNVSADLTMYGKPMTVSSTPIFQGQKFDVTFNVANFSNETMRGFLALDLYDLEGNRKEFIDLEYITLEAGMTFSQDRVFSSLGIDIPAGTYILAPTFKKEGTDNYFVLASYENSDGNYPNLMRVVVAEPPLEADFYENNNTDFQAYTIPFVFQNNQASWRTTGANIHTDTDKDYFQFNLSEDYEYKFTVKLKDQSTGDGTVDAVFSYQTTSGDSDVFDGKYTQETTFTVSNGGKVIFLVSPFFEGFEGTYQLDIQVTRTPKTPDLSPDQYESNNTTSEAYTLPLSFHNNSATVSTTGANLHDRWDNDVYKIVLPEGYTYQIKAQLRDSETDNNYTVDVNFAYRINNAERTDYFDVSIEDTDATLTLEGGNDLFFHANNYLGKLGTYELNIEVTREEIPTSNPTPPLPTGLESENIQLLEVFPNPASSKIRFKIPDNERLVELQLWDASGKMVFGSAQFLGQELDVSNFPQGIYQLLLSTNQQTYRQKIILQR